MTLRPIKHIIQNQKPIIAPATMCVSEAAALMKKSRVGAVAVLEKQRLVGIFTERDAVFRVLASGADRPFGHALHMMFEGGFRHVPVVENGKLIGIVSARDALGSDLAQFASDVQEREHIAEIL